VLFDGIVLVVCADAAESQAALGQDLAGLEGDIATLLLKVQSITETRVMVRRIESQKSWIR